MKYLLLLYDDADSAAAMSADERRAIIDEHIGFSRMLRERGAHVYSEPLDDPATARTVRFDAGDTTVTDGPFLESKEALGGFYVIDTETADDVLAIAAQVPRSPGLVVEVRPIPEV